MFTGGLLDSEAPDLDALSAAIDDSSAVPLSCLSTDEISDRLVALHQLSARLDAVRTATADQAKSIDLAGRNKTRTVADHVAMQFPIDPTDARADELIAVWLRDFPLVATAYAAGEITTAHVDTMRRNDKSRYHHLMRRDEQVLLDALRTCHFRDLKTAFGEWLLGADPDGEFPKDEVTKTGLTVTPLPGGFSRVRGTLDPLQTQALNNTIAPEVASLRASEAESGIKRTVANRTLTAVMRLLTRGAAREDGTFPAPLINISMSQRVYENTLARLADPTIEPVAINWNDPDARCHRTDGTPIHPIFAVAAATTGHFRRLVYGAKARPIEVSYSSRSFPNWMKDIFAMMTNGHCANPVCDAPFHWLHGDHITPHSHKPETTLDGGQLLCEPENLWKGNDPTRAVYPVPDLDMAEHNDDGDEFADMDEDWDAAELERLARDRIRKLVA